MINQVRFSNAVKFFETGFCKRWDDYLSFELLRLCPRKVIPMSTFSWWAAYLGGGDVIITKERKYKEGTAYSYIGGDELIPKTWKRI